MSLIPLHLARRVLLGVITCIVLAPHAARAQVNAEVLRPNPLRAGWSGGLDGSLALSRGNIELLDAGGAARLQLQTLHPVAPGVERPSALPFIHQRVLIAASGRFAERAGVPFINQAFVHARWTAMWHERLGSDVFAQYQRNEFQRLEGRAIAGLGVRVEAVHTRLVMLWAGSGYMFEYDRVDVLDGAPDPPETFEHRWTNYVTLRLAPFDGRLLVQNTLYYQPRFDAFSDARVLDELEVLTKVTDAFSLGATVSVLHDTAPPTGVRDTDVRVLNTVRLTF